MDNYAYFPNKPDTMVSVAHADTAANRVPVAAEQLPLKQGWPSLFIEGHPR